MSDQTLSSGMSSDTADIAANLAEIQQNIDKACAAVGREPSDVTLICVSKNHDADHVRNALVNSRRVFGENRVQEAAGKWPGLREEFPDVELHLIGPLQTNKLKDAVALPMPWPNIVTRRGIAPIFTFRSILARSRKRPGSRQWMPMILLPIASRA